MPRPTGRVHHLIEGARSMTRTDFNPDLLEQGSVVGSDGESIGKVGQVYVDNQTGQPSWVTVKTGWFGTSESFVPLDAASVDGDTIRVPYDKDTIKDAPHNEVGVELTETDETELYSYYGIGGRAATGTTGTGTDAELPVGTGQSGQGGEYLTRSEEQLHVGTEKVETGRARLRKYVVTENQTVTVPVSHEEVRVVREPMGRGRRHRRRHDRRGRHRRDPDRGTGRGEQGDRPGGESPAGHRDRHRAPGCHRSRP